MYFWNIHGNIGLKSEMAVSVSGGPRYHLGLKWWQIFSLRNNVLALASLFSVRKSFQMEENTSVLVKSVSLDNESGYEEGLNTSLDTADAGEPEQLDSLIADTSMLTLQTEVDSGHSLSTRWKHLILWLQNCLLGQPCHNCNSPGFSDESRLSTGNTTNVVFRYFQFELKYVIENECHEKLFSWTTLEQQQSNNRQANFQNTAKTSSCIIALKNVIILKVKIRDWNISIYWTCFDRIYVFSTQKFQSVLSLTVF